MRSDIYCNSNKNKEGEFYPGGGGRGVLQGDREIFSGFFSGRNSKSGKYFLGGLI